jgi:Tfp pilus assembly protein PilV
MTARRALRGRGPRGDGGVTLVDVLVAMGIMTTMMVIATGAVLQVYRSTVASETGSVAQAQIHLALQRLDRSIRYASAITTPNTTAVGGAWYVEYLGIDPGTGQARCTQLRLAPVTEASGAAGVLQLITWTPGSPPASGANRQTLASLIMLPDGNVPVPFERQLAGATSTAGAGTSFTPDYQRLRLRLTTRDGNSRAATDVTFTALDTSRDTASSNVCIEGRPSS